MSSTKRTSVLAPALVMTGRVSLVLGAIGGILYGIWSGLVRSSGLPEPWFSAATLLLWLGTLAVPTTYLIARSRGRYLPRRVNGLLFGWLGTLFYLGVSVGLVQVLHLLAPTRWFLTSGPSVAWIVALDSAQVRAVVSAILATVFVVAALVQAARGPIVVRTEIFSERFAAVDGLKIAQISDVHLGAALPSDYLARAVDQVNELAPHLVIITGDLLEEPAHRVAGQMECLRNAHAPLGAYFVSGNHDYFTGIEGCLAHLERCGVRPLRNQRITLRFGDGELFLAGVDDPTGRLVPGHGPDYERALSGRDESKPLVLLAHEPRAILRASHYKPDLQISGHTHAGQMWPFGFLVKLVEPYLQGLHRHGDTWIYVNRGTGYWGPPMRFPRRAEISLLTLRGARSAANLA